MFLNPSKDKRNNVMTQTLNSLFVVWINSPLDKPQHVPPWHTRCIRRGSSDRVCPENLENHPVVDAGLTSSIRGWHFSPENVSLRAARRMDLVTITGERRGWEWNRRRSPANRMDDERRNQRYFFFFLSFFSPPPLPPPATHWQRRLGEEEIGRAGVARHRARRDEDRAGEK